MKYFSIFSGIGGFEKGIEQAYATYFQNLLSANECEYEGTDSISESAGVGDQSANGLGNIRSERHNNNQYESAISESTNGTSKGFGNTDEQNNVVCSTNDTALCDGDGYERTNSGMGGNGRKDFRVSVGQKTVNGTRNHRSQTNGQNGCSEHGTHPKCIGYSEIDPRAVEIYRYHYPKHKNYGDANHIIPDELADFDLLVGGFPCQAFSIAGKRGGFDDTRGTLFFEIARILAAKKPRNFLLENVKGLFSHDSGRTFKTIIRTLNDIGYCVEWSCLNSKWFGVPQNRERVFLVGHFGGLPQREVFPLGKSNGQFNGQIGQRNDIAHTVTNSDKHRGSYDITPSPIIIDQKGKPKQNQTIASTFTAGGNSGGNHSDMDLIQIGTLRTHNDGKGFREMQDGNCPTIPARAREDGSGQPIIQTQSRIRRLTPIECERLQGFPDNHTKFGINDKGEQIEMSDTSRYKALGNAVTVNVIETIISKMIEVGRF